MTRFLAPGGQFVMTDGLGFTVSAYDRVTGQFIAAAHKTRAKAGAAVYPAECTLAEGESELKDRRKLREKGLMGVLMGECDSGVVGLAYGIAGEAILTGYPKVGQARLLFDALPDGGVEVNIGKVHVREEHCEDSFVFRLAGGWEQARGMSGSPILQDGKLVGVLYGGKPSGVCYGRPIEAMADALLDGIQEPEEPRPKKPKLTQEEREERRKRARERQKEKEAG